MTIKDFKLFLLKFKLSEQTKKVIENIREQPPSRNVRSGKKNVPGFYPSIKMAMSIQFESHTLELAAIYLKEHDSQVLEYYDQPPAFPIQYKITDKNNHERNHGHLYTPDFFVIEEDWIGWEEWKHEKNLLTLAIESPNRYLLVDGIWRCPPAEAYAEKFGLSFRIRTDKDINATYQRNLTFLEDYLLHKPSLLEQGFKEKLTEIVSNNPGISLKDLIKCSSLDPDNIYISLIHDIIYVDFFKSPLAEAEYVEVFLNNETAIAFSSILEVNIEKSPISLVIDVQVGSSIQWDGRKFVFLNIGETNYCLLSEDEKLVNIPVPVFEGLVKEGIIRGLNITKSKENLGLEIFKGSSKSQLEEANRKFQYVKVILNGGDISSEISERTLRHWVSKYKAAEIQFNNGFLGLLPQNNTKGNRNGRFPDKTLEFIDQYINEYYETPIQRNKVTVYKLLSDKLVKEGLTTPTYRAFCSMIDQRPVHEQTRKRKGTKAAYPSEPIYLELKLSTPRHGDRPFEICHIDHTELDIELVCSQTGKSLGRPWATFLVDAFSRRLLVVYITFDPPSYRTCMMVLRECVKRHSKLPQKLVVDGGKEFHSIYFDTLLAFCKIVKMERPGAKPKFGSVCERLFGTANTTFVHNLLGNTQMTKNVRQVTKEVNPKNLAVWNLGSFFEKSREWAYEVYDTTEHPALGLSPRDAYLNSVALTGKRQFAMINYDETFLMLTLPTTRKGTAKVEPGIGVKINSIYYWSDKLLHPEIESKQVPIRYDPYNMGIAYAYVSYQWILLNSTHYMTLVNRTEKEIQLATEELKKRMKLHGQQGNIHAGKLVQFLKSAEAEEVLQKQRLKDKEQKIVFDVINGAKLNQNIPIEKAVKKVPNLIVLPLVNNKKEVNHEQFVRLEEF